MKIFWKEKKEKTGKYQAIMKKYLLIFKMIQIRLIKIIQENLKKNTLLQGVFAQ